MSTRMFATLRNALLGLTTVAMMTASAANTHQITLFAPSPINGKTLPAGEYKIEVKDNVAILRQGKTVTEVPVRVENMEKKNSVDAVKYVNGVVQEIRLGGTNTKLVFTNPPTAAGM